MRELTVRITFTKHSLGNVKKNKSDGRFVFQRDPSTGKVIFLSSWHKSNMRFAAQLLGRHQDEVEHILWDIQIDSVFRHDPWYKRHYQRNDRRLFVLHEAFLPGQTIGINCVVPSKISDQDFWDLMRIAGQYRGLSPSKPLEYGLFTVTSIRPRRAVPESVKQEEVSGETKKWTEDTGLQSPRQDSVDHRS